MWNIWLIVISRLFSNIQSIRCLRKRKRENEACNQKSNIYDYTYNVCWYHILLLRTHIHRCVEYLTNSDQPGSFHKLEVYRLRKKKREKEACNQIRNIYDYTSYISVDINPSFLELINWWVEYLTTSDQ